MKIPCPDRPRARTVGSGRGNYEHPEILELPEGVVEEYQSVLDHARDAGLERAEYDPAMTDGGGDALPWR